VAGRCTTEKKKKIGGPGNLPGASDATNPIVSPARLGAG
jgi:hypothetical protein